METTVVSLKKAIFSLSGTFNFLKKNKVHESVPSTHSVQFRSGNLRKDKKIIDGKEVYNRVCLFFFNPKETPEEQAENTFILSLSEPLSRAVRAGIGKNVSKREILSYLMNLNIWVDKDNAERMLVMNEPGSPEPSFGVEELIEEEVKITHEMLVAW